MIRQPGSRTMEERLLPLPILTPSDVWRFWDKVSGYGSPGCWLWTGSLSHGVPNLKVNKIIYTSSRLAYLIQLKTDPGSMFVCHECNTPRCMNGKHFFLGTNSDNMKHRFDCNRHPIGSIHGSSKFHESEIPMIRERHRLGESIRGIARSLDVQNFTIEQIVNYQTWRHVP